ncbi:MAG: nuclear transport factor 2 family protein [Kiloniellales bacterium]
MDPRYAAVVELLQRYFDGLYHSDTILLRQVFHPQAIYACATDGKLLQLAMEPYFRLVDARPSPASRSEARSDRIASITFAGPVTAFAQVHCAIGPKRFTDFLSLIFLDGRWQIISKVFHYDLED